MAKNRDLGMMFLAGLAALAATDSSGWADPPRSNRLAMAHVQTQADSQPARPSATELIAQGDAAHDAGRTSEAADRYASALAADPASLPAAFRLTQVLVEMGRREDAASAMARLRAMLPEGITAEQRRAVDALQRDFDALTPAQQPATLVAPDAKPGAIQGSLSDDDRLQLQAATLILQRANHAADPQARAREIRGAEAALQPFMTRTGPLDAEVWTRLAILALVARDDVLAGVVLHRVRSDVPGFMSHPGLATVLPELLTRPGTEAARLEASGLPEGKSVAEALIAVRNRLGPPTDDAEAMSWYRRGAELGDANAMIGLSVRLLGGWGVPADHVRAVELVERAFDMTKGIVGSYMLFYVYTNNLGMDADRERALTEELTSRAERGEPHVMTWLGLRLASGRGVARDDAKAVKWYRRAAEQGDAPGQTHLGVMYAEGRGVARNDAEAVKWFRRAAEQGDAPGQIHLGTLYREGIVLARDKAEAVKWFRRAAEQGYAEAQFNLGVMYAQDLGLDIIYAAGWGVAQDDAEAVKWFRRAAERGYTEAQFNLGVMYAQGRGVARDDAEAVKWYRRAAEQGDGRALCELGDIYAEGMGVARDDAEAVKWYRQAAEKGALYAQNTLGVMYAKGRGVARDDAEAVEWYRRAAEKGYAVAQLNLGNMYADGRGVARDDAEAMKWYRRVAEKGYPEAQFNLGNMYADGRGVARDHAEAVKWYRRAAEQGLADAKFNLGVMYRYGYGVAKSEAEALKWMRRAAEQGHSVAQQILRDRGESW